MKKTYIRKPNHNCYICSKPIYVRPYTLNASKSGHAFCSNECYGISCRKMIPCAVCGNEILSGDNKKTCSRACANKQKTGMTYNQIGRPIKDAVKDSRAIRRRLIEHLGKNECQRCEYNKVPEVLHVHHIVEKSQGGSNELSNLELICPTCHDVEHYNRRQAKKLSKKSNMGVLGMSEPN